MYKMHGDREIYIHINRVWPHLPRLNDDTTRLLNPNTVQQPTPGKHILFF